MKCLEKEPKRRYDYATGLALDIQRHLEHQPVSAAAPAIGYRLGKFSRRHRRALTVSLGFALVLVIGVVLTVREELRVRHFANQSRERLVRLHLENGNRFLEAGEPLKSLPSFAEVLKLRRGLPEQEELLQFRMAAAVQQCLRLLQVWHHEPGLDGRDHLLGSRH